jgi:hypothetical protein
MNVEFGTEADPFPEKEYKIWDFWCSAVVVKKYILIYLRLEFDKPTRTVDVRNKNVQFSIPYFFNTKVRAGMMYTV